MLGVGLQVGNGSQLLVLDEMIGGFGLRICSFI